MRRWIALAVAMLVAAMPVLAGETTVPATVSQLDRRLEEAFRDGKIPGASVALIESGKITFAKGYGYADVSKNIPANADTPFRAGSISKAITAIGIMRLVERHKLSLDEKLAEFAPEIRFVNPWEKTNPVRLVDLLEHTTGWPDISTRVLAKDEKDWSTLQGVQFASSEFVSRWPPGQFTVYNNAGPAVAAIALEKASGKPFDAYVRDEVLRPMGMPIADFDLTPDLAKRVARSYAPDGSETPYQHIVLKPAGSLNVSARELAQLVRFYLSGGMVDGQRILSSQSVARIERSESNLGSNSGFTYAYALGNAIFPDSGLTFRGHNGSIDSFTSVMGYNRRTNSGYVLLANGGSGVDFATPIAHLVQAYLTRGASMRPQATVKIGTGALQRYAGFYRVIAPPNDLLRPYVEILNIARVRAGDGRLIVSGNDFFPVSAHLFRRYDREEPSLAFVANGGRVYKLGAFSAAVKESFWLIAAVFAVGALCVLGALIGIVMLIPWICWAAKRRLRDKGGLFMRLAPLASTLALAVTLALPLMAITGSGTSAIHQLADIGPYSLAILVCSVLFPLLAGAGLLLAVRNGGARMFVRGYVAVSSFALLVVAVYLASIGWIPMRSWVM